MNVNRLEHEIISIKLSEINSALFISKIFVNKTIYVSLNALIFGFVYFKNQGHAETKVF